MLLGVIDGKAVGLLEGSEGVEEGLKEGLKEGLLLGEEDGK